MRLDLVLMQSNLLVRRTMTEHIPCLVIGLIYPQGVIMRLEKRTYRRVTCKHRALLHSARKFCVIGIYPAIEYINVNAWYNISAKYINFQETQDYLPRR